MNAWPLFVLPTLGACAGVAAWGAVSSTSQLFGPTLSHTPKPSEIALTFDDCPNPVQTSQFLRLLERYHAPATFFLIGRFARTCPQLVREIADRGHGIGNHTETHANLAWLPARQIADELRGCQESISSALAAGSQAAPILMRPPFGYRGPQLFSAVHDVGLRGVAMWSLKCYEWRARSAERLIERLRPVMGRVRGAAVHQEKDQKARTEHGGEVILLHDGDARKQGSDRRHVLVALEYWLPRWRDAGFEFVTMNEVAAGLRTGGL